jgi:hypothetical protein
MRDEVTQGNKETIATQCGLLVSLIVILFTAGCRSDKSYRLVSEKYNFSVEFPEKPTEETKVNDEGLPKIHWQVSHEKIVAKDYLSAEATSYKETLNPDDELESNEGLLVLAGIKLVEHSRFKMKARETGREVDALQTFTQDSTGSMISTLYVVDTHNMIHVTARMNDNPGKSAVYLSSFTILK